VLDGSGADTIYLPILGPAAATISCVGVAPHMEGRGIGTALVARASEILRDRGVGTCHISWTVRESFYTRAGYRPWYRYRMFRVATSPARPRPPLAKDEVHGCTHPHVVFAGSGNQGGRHAMLPVTGAFMTAWRV
jgi:predicted GNAT family acetyltransferase